MKSIQLFTALITFISTLAFASGAYADSGPAGEDLWQELNATQARFGPEAANQQFDSLSADEKQAVLHFLSDTEITIDDEVPVVLHDTDAIQTAGCWGWPRTISVTNRLTGALFFRYTQRIEWCSTGSSFYNLYCEAWPSDQGWGWTWDDHVTYCSLSNNGYSLTYFSQGHFCTGSSWGCLVDSTPWVRQGADVTGGFWSEVGE